MYIQIPIAKLPKVTVEPGRKIRLPKRLDQRLTHELTNAEICERYYIEALEKLALAVYWAEREDE